jgi:gluconate 5-dehydrogenase
MKKTTLQTTLSEFRAMLETHVMAAFALTRAFAPGMIERSHGSILLVASMTSLIGMPKVVAYTAAKTACLGLMRSLTADLAPHNIRVNAITPGWIDTPMLHDALDSDPERTQKILSRTPMQRFGDLEDIGWASLYLCSPAAKFITGTMLTVDGGAHMGF